MHGEMLGVPYSRRKSIDVVLQVQHTSMRVCDFVNGDIYALRRLMTFDRRLVMRLLV